MTQTPGSSMDKEVLAEAEELIYGVQTISSERAEELEACEYNAQTRNEYEINDQIILEMQLVVASKGWGYICKFWQDLIDNAEKEMKDPNLSDTDTINKKRDWLALKKAVESAKTSVFHAAQLPLSADLPR